MGNKNTDIESKVEQTLNSLDGIKRAGANPFLFEKIKSRMKESSAYGRKSYRLVAATVLGALAVLLLNFAVWTSYTKDSNVTVIPKTTLTTETKQDINSFAKEYFEVSKPENY